MIFYFMLRIFRIKKKLELIVRIDFEELMYILMKHTRSVNRSVGRDGGAVVLKIRYDA